MSNIDINKLNSVIDKLRLDIRFWRKETNLYRLWNNILFGFFKVLIPFGSLTVAASAFSNLQNQNIFSPSTTLIIAITVVVLSGLDSILNPGSRKRLGFQKNNALMQLEYKLNIDILNIPPDHIPEYIKKIIKELKDILDDYSDRGY